MHTKSNPQKGLTSMYSTPLRSFALALGIVAISGLCGCGAKTASVSGRVTYDGMPLTGGSLILYCQDKQIVRGVIGPDGSYTIPNVPRGLATVTILAHVPIPAGLKYQQKNIPATKDGPIPPTFDSSRSGDATAIPEHFGLPEESGLSVTVDRRRVVYNLDLMP